MSFFTSKLAKSLKIKKTLTGAFGSAKTAALGKVAQSVTSNKMLQEKARAAIEEQAASAAGSKGYELWKKYKTSVILGGSAVLLLSFAGLLSVFKKVKGK